MPRLKAPLLAMAACGLASCGAEEQDAAVRPGGAAASSGHCVAQPGSGGGKRLPCPTPTVAAGEHSVVVMRTTEGSLEITLDTRRAPRTANSFAYLVKRGFYDGLTFHRVVEGFVVQGGDPDGDGSGGPGYTVTEAPPAKLAYRRGVVAMAKTAAEPAGASGSQFFVVSARDAGLPPDYALAGKVTKGLATVDKITALGAGDGVPPKRKVTIVSARLLTR